MKKQFFGAIILAFALFACSEPKAATKENFEVVINKYLLENKDSYTCSFFGNKFPFVDEFGIRKKDFQEYIELGLFKEEKEEKLLKLGIFGGDKVVKISTYDLTDLGKQHFKDGKFCFGTPKVEEIINFTEPADFMGQKVTEVNYKYKLKNLPEWYKIETMKERRIVLVLMNDGWSYK